VTISSRTIPDRLRSPLEQRLKSWEALLLLVAICIFAANSFASPYFLNAWNLSDATFNFTEKAMIAFAMALLIISGEIDLSVASIIALSSTAMGAAVQMGMGTPILVLIGLGVGLLCGSFNGLLVTRMGLPSIVVTIGTMSLFRGISFIVLGDQAYRGYPSDFSWLDKVMSGGSYRLSLRFLWSLPRYTLSFCIRLILGAQCTQLATIRPVLFFLEFEFKG
jgi:rhamnose transport system permease protein